VLADDPYTCLNAKNIPYAFFAIRFRAPTWDRWIVRGSGCLRPFSFITIFVRNIWVLLLWFTESVLAPKPQSCIFFS